VQANLYAVRVFFWFFLVLKDLNIRTQTKFLIVGLGIFWNWLSFLLFLVLKDSKRLNLISYFKNILEF